MESVPVTIQDSIPFVTFSQFNSAFRKAKQPYAPSYIDKKWKMRTAVGGGPVLIQGGTIQITNNEERKFMGQV